MNYQEKKSGKRQIGGTLFAILIAILVVGLSYSYSYGRILILSILFLGFFGSKIISVLSLIPFIGILLSPPVSLSERITISLKPLSGRLVFSFAIVLGLKLICEIDLFLLFLSLV